MLHWDGGKWSDDRLGASVKGQFVGLLTPRWFRVGGSAAALMPCSSGSSVVAPDVARNGREQAAGRDVKHRPRGLLLGEGGGKRMSSTGGNRKASRLPTLGRRGEGWVAAQILLIVAVFLSALVGQGWSGGYAVVAHTVGATLFALGLALLVTAGLQLGTSLTPFPTPKGDEITTSGTFALVRHPMYGGGILIALGWTIIFASVVGLAVTGVLALFLDLKSRREEIWLSERYDEYAAFREQTPHKLVPFIY